MADLAQGQGTKQVRRIITIRGAVQGVGFRPFVYQWAHRCGVRGWVANTSFGVLIEAEAEPAIVAEFVDGIPRFAPPLARIESLTSEFAEAAGYSDFIIRNSQAQDGQSVTIVPDLSICDDCGRELLDPSDRRYRYPFINCTNCGPRFTIIRDIPYDRPATTMAPFPMCPDCDREYHDPMDRRFHAQPDACPVCGPQLSWHDRDGVVDGNEASLAKAIQALRGGRIIALKGLGGFHLACRADDEQAVRELRRRKRRWGKPLAVMMTNLEMVQAYCLVSTEEGATLTSQRRPIVLLAKTFGYQAPTIRGEGFLAPSVAPGVTELGVMLPYTPLHMVLMDELQVPLVMTSGNLSEEPLCKDNDEALTRLAQIADGFLLHNREIETRVDDTVLRVLDGKPLMLRRARGYAPEPFFLQQEGRDILACGPEQKSTFCLVKGNKAIQSPHLGDLDSALTYDHYLDMLRKMSRLFRVQPQVLAHDLHPDYLATRYAAGLAGVELIGVQHHHAHIAACMAEHRLDGPVIGVAYDGTGYGLDGAIWGGEILVAGLRDFSRAAHLAYTPLPGGEQAIRNPYRMAAAYLVDRLGLGPEEWPESIRRQADQGTELLTLQIRRRLNSPLTSSMGRLFDGVAALLGICPSVSYEGQAAIELESAAAPGSQGEYPLQLDLTASPIQIPVDQLIRAILDDLQAQTPTPIIAARFHQTIASLTVEICQHLSSETQIRTVCLAGGVWQNRRLLLAAISGLRAKGLSPYWPQSVPINDGGIALGQAAIARAREESSCV